MTVTITREYEFAAAHMLEGHPKCGRLHGHNYIVEVTVCNKDDELTDGMIVDFHDLDVAIKPIIDMLDHRCIISLDNVKQKNEVYLDLMNTVHLVVIEVEHSTAEELSIWIARNIQATLPFKIMVRSITLWENRKSSATYSPS